MSDTLTLTPPPEMAVPRMRFWGERKPPKNRAQMFSMRVATSAALVSASTDGTVDQVGNVATLRIYGPIDSWGGWWGISAKDVASALDDLPDDVTELRVRINSPGGEVWEGLAILNMLRAHKARAIAVVDGLAASAASLIATGCDETVMSPGTQLMIHDPSGFAYGPAAVMAKAQKFLNSCGDATSSIYSESAGGSDADWRALMIEETWYTAQEAVEAGLADRVGVVADAGGTATAGDEPDEPVIVVIDPDDDDVEQLFDLTIFSHAGRSQAPAPVSPARSTPAAPADGSTTSQGMESAVAFSDEQLKTVRQELGIAEDADEATIVAALSEALKEQADDSPASTTLQIPEGMALVDSALLKELQTGASAGQTAQTTLLNQERDQVIDQALKDGKIAATSREQFVSAWDKDAASTRSILDALTPGVVPTSEVGHENEPGSLDAVSTISDAELNAFAASLGLDKEALRG